MAATNLVDIFSSRRRQLVKKVIAIAVFLFCSIAHAATVTIDFESPIASQGFQISSYATEGIYAPEYDVGTVYVSSNNGTNVFGATAYDTVGQDGFGSGVYFTLSRIDGQAFSLHGYDVFANSNGYYSTSGRTSDGTAISLSTALGTGDWLNVTSVQFSSVGDGFSYSYADLTLDNIIVGAAVPVPAAIWLFGSALAGLGWFRRKTV
jgi:hypothetical protein